MYCGLRLEPTRVMTHLGRTVSHQSASSCLRVCLCGDCCCRVRWWPQRHVLLHTLLERCRHTVSCDLGITLPPVIAHDNAAPPFFTGSCCYCSASRAATEYTSIASPSRKPPSPPAALAPFNGLTKTSTLQDHCILRTTACCCCSSRLVDTALDLLHERPSDLHRISKEIPSETRQLC